jgi:hypothetical protein
MHDVTSSDSTVHSPPSPHAAIADVEALGERIAELSAQIQAATYQLLVMIQEFDERGGWGVGFRSCAHWLNWRAGFRLGAAREKVRVARALAELPLISASMARGEISFSKVRAMTRVATAANEAELLEFARAGSAAHVERLVRAWRRVDRNEEMEHEERRHASRALMAFVDEDGMVVVRGRLTPEAGAALLRALDAAGEKLYEQRRGERGAGEEASPEQKRADALGLMAESALTGGLDPGTRGDRYQVVVHVDAEALPAGSECGESALEDGQHVSAETSRRLACDAARVDMLHGPDGSILDVGRRTRTVPPALRRALAHRDGGCRFPGCGLRLCDAHHMEHWADGGATRLDNLVQLCRRHHRAVHEEGFTVELLEGGEARFRRPDGRAGDRGGAGVAAGGGRRGGGTGAAARRAGDRGGRRGEHAQLAGWAGGDRVGGGVDAGGGRAVRLRGRWAAGRSGRRPPREPTFSTAGRWRTRSPSGTSPPRSRSSVRLGPTRRQGSEWVGHRTAKRSPPRCSARSAHSREARPLPHNARRGAGAGTCGDQGDGCLAGLRSSSSELDRRLQDLEAAHWRTLWLAPYPGIYQLAVAVAVGARRPGRSCSERRRWAYNQTHAEEI